jgi:hypothetical protein
MIGSPVLSLALFPLILAMLEFITLANLVLLPEEIKEDKG